MYLATSLGIGRADASAGNVEEFYERMVGEDPSNPLFLRNYAQLLQVEIMPQKQKSYKISNHQQQFKTIWIDDPKDVEILLLYAKLVWKLHQDQDRALNYFKRAAQATLKIAYACFLWEIEEDKEDCSVNDHTQLLLGIDVAVVGGINVADFGKGGNTEDYYKRMVEENHSNRLFLRNYAQFLYQLSNTTQGVNARFGDPADGEIISQYAKLVWELHHDQDKAMSYFERAVQAIPGDSHVLAAYANFLWQAEKDEEEDGAVQDHIQAPLFLRAMTAANV
ncbi:hypothetical protein LOK49_LG09G00999 [Camellia lanceoleosa]|uniref:Uncharacterized protein n=1 Tax=Camellia lanceoleosa TaxID=1840588 RepID=A0ACC0GFM5_9ERIC|nr:hypothetical protein LOK49_LG09G00999 [Camellia lanceoleosa]